MTNQSFPGDDHQVEEKLENMPQGLHFWTTGIRYYDDPVLGKFMHHPGLEIRATDAYLPTAWERSNSALFNASPIASPIFGVTDLVVLAYRFSNLPAPWFVSNNPVGKGRYTGDPGRYTLVRSGKGLSKMYRAVSGICDENGRVVSFDEPPATNSGVATPVPIPNPASMTISNFISKRLTGNSALMWAFKKFLQSLNRRA